MNTPDPTVPESNSVKDPLRSRNRLWRWGIWFWLVAWIFSIITELELSANLKGITCVRMAVGLGNVGMTMTYDSHYSPNIIRIYEAEFIWSHLEYVANNTAELFGILGHVRGSDFVGPHMQTFPVAGFLWVWLIGAWTHDFKKARWLGSIGSRHMIARLAILISLPLLILISDHQRSIVAQSYQCISKIRDIQSAVRSHNSLNNIDIRAAIDMPWDEIFGPKKFLPLDGKNCPGGPSYRLIKHLPRIGEMAAECPNPEHQRRMKICDTSAW